MPQLQRFDCRDCVLRVEGVRALQPALRSNRTLKQVNLSSCQFGYGGIRLIADALVGNKTMDRLDIRGNDTISDGLDEVTRLIESTQLKMIHFDWHERNFFDLDIGNIHRFVTALKQQKSRVGGITTSPGLRACDKK
jgi:Leucine Rich repeat